MIVTQYSIEKRPKSGRIAFEWVIEMTLTPTWFERILFGKAKPETRTLIGSCSTWKWLDGSNADYIWRHWAFYAVSKHVKSRKGTLDGTCCTYRKKKR